MPSSQSFRNKAWLAASLATLALWTACRDVTAPEPARHVDDATIKTTSNLGTLGGTVYFSLWPSETVWSIDPNGGSPVQVTTGAVVRVAPGGQRLAVVRNLDQALVTVNVDGTNVHTLRTSGPAIIAISWSPDGKKVAAYTDGLDTPSQIVIYDDSTGASTTVTAPRPAPEGALDWRAGKWAIVWVDGQNLPNDGGFQSYGVLAAANAGSGSFVNLTEPTYVDVGSGIFSPVARKAKLDSAGAVWWSGQNWQTNQFGIFSSGGAFRLNTGLTPDFAFSPKQDAVAAIRQTAGAGVSIFNLDIIDWSGPYVRTLYNSQLSAFSGNKIMSVDWSHPLEVSPPTALITYLGTGTANEFSFSGSGSLANSAGASIKSYEWNFGDGTTTGETVTHTFSSPGEHVVKLKVTDTNDLQDSTSVTLSPRLTISTVTLSPDSIGVGDSFSIQVLLRNDGGVPLTDASPSVNLVPASLANITGTPSPATKDLAAGEQATFTYTLSALVAGSDTAIVNASAMNGGSPVNAVQRRRNFSIGTAGLVVQLSADSTTVDAGKDFTVTASITNNGVVDVVNTSATLTSDPVSGVTIGTPAPLSITRLTQNASGDIKWTVRASQSGPLKLHVDVSGKDDDAGALTRSASKDLELTVIDHRLVVTSVADDSLSTNQLQDSVCDVNAGTPGNQCTLRAAIQLANSFAGAQSITFDIPGGGVPSIAPSAALPPLTASITLDASTQSGGWVQLSGSGTSGATGLILNGNQSLVKGFVVNHWKIGIGLNGNSSRVTGNRIGTNASGTDTLHNGIGILVKGSDVTIGGIAGTTGTACSGACNLISGNNEGIWVSGGSNIHIEGNWIGTNVTGLAALPNALGVVVSRFEGGDDEPASTVIGGSTTKPGLAPGNLISGNSTGIEVGAGGGTEIYGNLIGLNRTGNATINNPDDTTGFNGIDVTNKPTGYVTIGANAGRGNVISGFSGSAIFVLAAGTVTILVQENLIGLTADGNSAAPNGNGVVEDDDPVLYQTFATTQVLRNVISGSKGSALNNVDLAAGNRVGTNAAGTAAIPNLFGINGVKKVGGLRPPGSTACEFPCNLISGNTVHGVDVVDTLQGNFIGVDITGTSAIPNGVGVRNSVLIGGPSQAVKGICDRACNLIAGNDSAGVWSVIIATVQGNVIGAPGIGNKAQGILSFDYGLDIGGDNETGNSIQANGLSAIELRTTDASQRPQIEANSVTGNGGGILYTNVNGADIRGPNPPVIDSIIHVGSTTKFWGHLTDFLGSNALSARVDVFGSADCESGPQGAVPLGHATVGILAGGEWSLDVTGVNASLDVFTSTSTYSHATSSFSECRNARPDAKLSAGASAGADRVELSSNAGFTIGGWAKLNTGNANAEWKNITAFGSLIFSSPLIYAHATDEVVVPASAPPPAGWLVGSGGDVTAFGEASTLSGAKAKSIIGAAATPTGLGMRMLGKDGVVYAAGNAPLFGDASNLLGKQELAVSIFDSHDGLGYYIVTNKARVLTFGDAQSLTPVPSPILAKDKTVIAAAAGSPSRNGYVMVTACGEITTSGDAQSSASVPAPRCDVIGVAVPNGGTGAWILHADGRVDATGDAPALGSVTGKFSALIGIIAQGDGYVVAESNGKMHGFGTTSPTSNIKGQAAVLVPLLR